jgi:hypothetical protein
MEGARAGAGMGDHDWLHNPDDAKAQGDAADQIGKDAADNGGLPQDLEDKKADDDHKGTPGAGPGSEAGAMRRFTEEKGVSMKWAELIRRVNPDFFKSGGPRPVPSYHRTPRKLHGVYAHYPNMGILPVRREPEDPRGETPSIVLFMDGSGSCSHYINTFATLAKSVPEKKLHLRAWTFSTYTLPFDVKEDNPKMASGGTAFSPIEQTIQEQVVPDLGHYPHAVVVMTDGEGYFNSPTVDSKFADRWLWLLTDGGRFARSYGPRPGEDVSIDEFCDGMKGIAQPRAGWR